MPRWSLLILVAAISLAATPWHSASAQSTPVASPLPPPQPTALLVFTAQDPSWVPASDGEVHLVYDLVMTNIFTSPVTITSVDVLTTDSAPLLHLEDDALLAVTRPVFGDTPTVIAPTSGAIVTLVDVPVPADDVPQRLTHRVTYALEPGAPAAALLSSRVGEGPEAILVDRAPQVIAPPLRGDGWANLNGCCAASPHRSLRLVVDGSQIKTIQMFAIDWAKLDAGATYTGEGARNEDHHAFGQDLLAVADGRVVFVRDDLADNTPFHAPVLQEPGDLFGNQIVLEIAPGVYAFYAHLQQGSARVQAGDLVQAGDTLGKLGNSGASESPHLHFQLSDGSDPMTATSLPFVIDAWTLEGSVSPDNGQTGMQVSGPAGPQSATLPLELTVASFAPPGKATPEPAVPTTPAAATPATAAAQTTALLAKAVDDPLWVVGSDEKVHLEYGLLFTNVSPAPVTLSRIDVLSPDGQILLTLQGDALRAMTQPTFGGAPTTVVPASGAVVTMLDVVLPPGHVPERVGHRITYALSPDSPANALFSSTGITWPDLLVEAGAPRVIASPLRGTGWLNANGCCDASPHRSARLAIDGSHLLDIEAFAIDWVKLEGGTPYAGDGARNEDHFAFGEAVFAVADGTVVSVRDGVPDNEPFTLPQLRSPADYGGNQVMMRLDSGEYAYFAHLQPGSVRVRPGDRVATGDILGLLGNSGASDAPRLHFQLSDGPDVLTSASLPFVIDAWTLAGAVLDEPGADSTTELAGPEEPQIWTFPLQGTVADFP